MTGESAITTRGLTKRFGRVVAVDGIDLDVPAGSRYGFLGPNGSGKTTTVRMLLGLVYPSAGEMTMLGTSMPRGRGAVLPHVGALIEGPAAYGHLAGRTNLSILDAAAPGRSRRTRRARVQESLERVGLAGVDRRPVKNYSLGMRQRLGLAAALLGAPRLLILDEPTNGLDPRGIHETRDLLEELNAAGTTVFLSSHLLAEVELLCTHVGVLDRGALVLQQPIAALRQRTGRVTVRTPDRARAKDVLDGQVIADDLTGVVVRSDDPAGLNRLLVASGVRVEGLVEEMRTLEQTVLEVTRSGADRIDSRPA